MSIMWLEGISVITPTTRKTHMSQILSNFMRQKFINKELIIVINNDEMKPADFKLTKLMLANIHIYQLAASKSLGECLNMAIEQAKYNYIAKFDDDDYYAPGYLDEMYATFKKEDCDVVCKQNIFYYLEKYEELLLLPKVGQDRKITRGAGATIGAKRTVFNKIQFVQLSVGTDTDFFRKCRYKGLKCCSTSSYNYLCFRSKDVNQHTWQITEREIKIRCRGYFSKAMNYEEACAFVGQYKT